LTQNFVLTSKEYITSHTSAIVSDIGLGTQTSLLWITNSVSWTIVVNFTFNYANAFNVRIGIWYGFFRTSTSVRTFSIGARCSMPANIRFGTFVNICIY